MNREENSKENPIYHIGTLPCTNRLRDSPVAVSNPDKLAAVDPPSNEDCTNENLYESIDSVNQG